MKQLHPVVAENDQRLEPMCIRNTKRQSRFIETLHDLKLHLRLLLFVELERLS